MMFSSLRRRLGRRNSLLAADVIRRHFHPTTPDQLTITQRSFPFRVRADLQRALDDVASSSEVGYFCGLRQEYAHGGVSLTDCLVQARHNPVLCVPPEYEEIDVGDELPIRCLRTGMWTLARDGERLGLFVGPAERYGEMTGLRVELAVCNTPEGTRVTQSFFRGLETAIGRADSYRGKILSLEMEPHNYTGQSTGVKVHRLQSVAREQVILPGRTLELLERNVIGFVGRRAELAKRGLPTKKGLLFYGQPGTGKTHTIHFLAEALPGHTMLIITAEQVSLLDEYMTLARLLQPSIVVIEDVDLIARDRTSMHSGCEEVLLNKLLNQMDGLKEDADIMFVLTTNRPDMLEPALASRPGRIDQAIEFPLPDDDGRRKLARLYAAGMELSDDLIGLIADKTDGVSAAFIKELMRRSCQFQLESDGQAALEAAHVDQALEEMLFKGGTLNRVLLGAAHQSIGFERDR